MKVGDLVTLSAYGKKLKLLSHCAGKVGIVTKHWFEGTKECFWVAWCGSAKSVKVYRIEIKHVK